MAEIPFPVNISEELESLRAKNPAMRKLCPLFVGMGAIANTLTGMGEEDGYKVIDWRCTGPKCAWWSQNQCGFLLACVSQNEIKYSLSSMKDTLQDIQEKLAEDHE